MSDPIAKFIEIKYYYNERNVVSKLHQQNKQVYSKYKWSAGADPGFQVRGGGTLKKLHRAEGGA